MHTINPSVGDTHPPPCPIHLSVHAESICQGGV